MDCVYSPSHADVGLLLLADAFDYLTLSNRESKLLPEALVSFSQPGPRIRHQETRRRLSPAFINGGWVQHATSYTKNTSILGLAFPHTENHTPVYFRSEFPGSDHRVVHGRFYFEAFLPNPPVDTDRPPHPNWRLLPSLLSQLDRRCFSTK